MSSVQAGAGWEYRDLKFWGLSLSGIRTSIAMPDLSFAFDVAQGYPFALNLKKFFISHGHLDHAAGIPYIISQKAMTSQPPAHFYMPSSLVEPMKQIMNLWESIEKHQYNYHFVAVGADDEVELNKQYFMKAFPTSHRIDSLGYTLFAKNKRLKAEHKNKSQSEIRQLAANGHKELQEFVETPLVSFTGDTTIEFLHSRPWITQSQVLILEATYLDDRKTTEHARQWGHTHLDEIIPLLDVIQSEKIVLIHVSSRYPTPLALEILKQKIPPQHQERVVLFPGR